jgi:hypothetical protein
MCGDPPQNLAIFIAGQEINDLCELKNRIRGLEKLLPFVTQVRDKQRVASVVGERETNEIIQVPSG